MSLTAKQRRFVDEYLVDLNATQAAIRAGYSAKTAGQIGERLLKKVEIQEATQQRMKDRSRRTEITQDRVLQELAKIGFSDIRRAVSWGAAAPDPEGDDPPLNSVWLVPSEEVDPDTSAAISEISQTAQGIKIKLHDKRAALVDIGRHLGMFKDKLEVTGKDGGPLQHTEVSKEEFAQIAAQIASEV